MAKSAEQLKLIGAPTSSRRSAPISKSARRALRRRDETRPHARGAPGSRGVLESSRSLGLSLSDDHRTTPHHRWSNPTKIGSDNVRRSYLFLGIISGERRRGHVAVADRADRIAGGLQRLGVRQGNTVCMLMRNDIALIEAAYAAMRLGAYGVPINWHFKPEEINYVLKDSGTPALIGHADMLHRLRDAIPTGITALSAPTPPEILDFKIDPDHLLTPDFAIDLDSWLELFRP